MIPVKCQNDAGAIAQTTRTTMTNAIDTIKHKHILKAMDYMNSHGKDYCGIVYACDKHRYHAIENALEHSTVEYYAHRDLAGIALLIARQETPIGRNGSFSAGQIRQAKAEILVCFDGSWFNHGDFWPNLGFKHVELNRGK